MKLVSSVSPSCEGYQPEFLQFSVVGLGVFQPIPPLALPVEELVQAIPRIGVHFRELPRRISALEVPSPSVQDEVEAFYHSFYGQKQLAPHRLFLDFPANLLDRLVGRTPFKVSVALAVVPVPHIPELVAEKRQRGLVGLHVEKLCLLSVHHKSESVSQLALNQLNESIRPLSRENHGPKRV